MATPPPYGMTAEGVVAPSQDLIRAYFAAVSKEIFGASSTVDPTTLNGKLVDFATRIGVMFFEGGAGAANASWFTGARGVALEKILALFAFPKIPASSSVVSLVLYGSDATIIGGGSLASVETTKTKFITQAATALGGDQGYVVELQTFVIGAEYTVTIAGQPWSFIAATDDGQDIAEGVRDAIIAGGQQITAIVPPFANLDGHWLLVVEDNGLGPFTLTASADNGALVDYFQAKRVLAISENTGPYEALAGTLNTIETPVAGWEGVVNTADADLGANAESDAAYRLRHRRQLMGKGSASEQAIEDAVAQLAGVEYVKVRANDTDAVDVEGLPPHSIRVTVLGGDDIEIAQTIMRKKAAGIQTYGNESEFVLDGEGFLKEIFYQRPIKKYVWVGIVLLPGEKYPQVGDPEATVAAAVALWGDVNLTIGDDVERYQFGTPINTVPGIKGATITLGFTLNENDPQPPLIAADLVMSSVELPLFDSSRVLVST